MVVAVSLGLLLSLAVPSAATQSGCSITIGSDALGVRLSLVSGRLAERGFVVAGAPMPGLVGQPGGDWQVESQGTR